MEVDPPSPENSDQAGGRISLEQQVQTHTQKVRSYDCNFCKRGFSNAQALGGHMNIHRRDRAKLSEPSTIIIKKDPSASPSPSPLPVVSIEPSSSFVLDSSENKACTLRRPWRIVSGELQQLQLFVERSSSSSEHDKSGSDGRETQTTTEGYNKELDLELRLGPES